MTETLEDATEFGEIKMNSLAFYQVSTGYFSLYRLMKEKRIQEFKNLKDCLKLWVQDCQKLWKRQQNSVQKINYLAFYQVSTGYFLSDRLILFLVVSD